MSRANAPACPVCAVHTESVYRVDGLDCHEEVALLSGTSGICPASSASRPT